MTAKETESGLSEVLLTQAEELVAINTVVSNLILLRLDESRSDSHGRSIEELTSFRCIELSEETLLQLLLNYFSLFQQAFIIQSQKNPESPFYESWDLHVMLVLQGKSGQWYALSPANFNSLRGEDDPMSKIYIADSLQDLTTEIEHTEGGSWNVPPETAELLKYPRKVRKSYSYQGFNYSKVTISSSGSKHSPTGLRQSASVVELFGFKPALNLVTHPGQPL